ncbi:MAG: BatA and WFA domain-containing protein, partial [Victivallales bacterium]|nr:BatA and WFA domain-containing protein [Victivallales bacterium]
MSLAITNPLFIWLLPVALLPLVFHLYYRLRRKPVKFPSFMFFLMIDRRFSAKRRIREYLLLLARMLFIALLLLALSGIVATGTKSEGTRHSMAIVIDNSSSMGMEAISGGRSNFELAIETAGKIVAAMGGGDRAALILTVEDPAASLPAGCTDDKNLLKASLDNLALTEAQGNIPAALNKALATLEKTHADRFEIHVLSDMQQHEWQASAPIALDSLSTNFHLTVHRMPVKAPERGNAAIASMCFLEPRFIVNRASVLEITLFNNSLHDAQFQLDIRDSSGSARSETITLQAGAESVVHHNIVPKLNGLHWAAAQIEGDSFAGDNKAFIAFNCSGVRKVLLCGDVKDFGVLPLAIAPAPDGALSGMVNVFCPPESIKTAMQDDKPLFIALAWQSIPALDEQSVSALKAFVSDGGSMLVLPSSVSPESAGNVPQWLGAKPGRPLMT